MRYSKNAEFNGRCVRLVLLPGGTEVLYLNDRGEFNIEPVGAPSYAQALQMAKRRAEKESVMLEVLDSNMRVSSIVVA